MDGVAEDSGRGFEAAVCLSYFINLDDPRQRGKITYPRGEVLVLTPLAVMALAETFVDIARSGAKKLEFLRRFRPFRDGPPADDHPGGKFAVPA